MQGEHIEQNDLEAVNGGLRPGHAAAQNQARGACKAIDSAICTEKTCFNLFADLPLLEL